MHSVAVGGPAVIGIPSDVYIHVAASSLAAVACQ